jgi:predicted alpha/beta-fold hydrolase
MARAMNRMHCDAAALNFRGCSGEPNRRLRLYHSGDSDDLRAAIDHILKTHHYRRIDLAGFSMGGNIVLKYLGEEAGKINPAIGAAAVFSVPCDLASSAMKMNRPSNRIYMARFLEMLHNKIHLKMRQFPGRIDDTGYDRIRTFKEFDDRYTAPLHGFASAEDYWEKASSKPILKRIAVPVLLVNAADDPILAEPCFPLAEAIENPMLFLETPKHGGHVGFVEFNRNGLYWSEWRTGVFFDRWNLP